MENATVPSDDLLDVLEMTQKIESYVTLILQDNAFNLSMSALMNATINCILKQCNNLDEVFFYRNLLIEFFDQTIETINVEE